ncbi:hypothetical protein FVEN_g13141 [Fusarium venenatum]|nr:hypothetical protein FVEN_g13141 [Fusarium venenatum]
MPHRLANSNASGAFPLTAFINWTGGLVATCRSSIPPCNPRGKPSNRLVTQVAAQKPAAFTGPTVCCDWAETES